LATGEIGTLLELEGILGERDEAELLTRVEAVRCG